MMYITKKCKVVKDPEYNTVYNIYIRKFFIWIKRGTVHAEGLQEAMIKAQRKLKPESLEFNI